MRPSTTRPRTCPPSSRSTSPKGVGVYFDNVGGSLLDLLLARIANKGRVVLCGAISSYNDEHRPPGPANYLNLIPRQASMRGFLSLYHWDRFGEIQPILEALVASGQPRHRTEVFQGLESAVDALNAMFTGADTDRSSSSSEVRRRCLRLRDHQPGLVGSGHRLRAVAQAELGEDPADVGLDRLLADRQAGRDLGVRQAFGGQAEDLGLARGQRLERRKR